MASYEEYRHGGKRRNLVFKMPIGSLVTLRRLPCRRPVPNLPSAAMYPNGKSRGRRGPRPWCAGTEAAVRTGEIAASTAADIAERPIAEQKSILESLPRDAEGKLMPEAKKLLSPLIKEIRAERQAKKKERRDSREAELGRKMLAMPEGKFGVAIEDFEWDHEPWSRRTGMEVGGQPLSDGRGCPQARRNRRAHGGAVQVSRGRLRAVHVDDDSA